MPPRNSKQLSGDAGEARAAAFLESRGLRIIERNFRVKGGELDLIARDGSEIVFVEVRRRATASYGGAAASITASKQRRLILAARHWLLRHGEQACRFDAVVIDGERLEWLRAAFAAG